MTLHDRLKEAIRQLVNDPGLEIGRKSRLDDIAGWDSMVQINLMFALEQDFGVRFAGSEIFEFETAGQLEDFVAAQVETATARSGR